METRKTNHELTKAEVLTSIFRSLGRLRNVGLHHGVDNEPRYYGKFDPLADLIDLAECDYLGEVDREEAQGDWSDPILWEDYRLFRFAKRHALGRRFPLELAISGKYCLKDDTADEGQE